MKAAAAVAVSLALLGSGVALAQETTGAIIGTVTSEDGVGLPGVTLTIHNPDKGLEWSTVSSADGSYKFVAVPPARYALQANLDGFQGYRRDIKVDLGRTVKNDLTMALGAVTQTIEVTGQAPLVDVTSTVSGMTVDADEFTGRVPVGRESTQIALMAPSTVDADRRFNSDYTPGQELVAVLGSSPAENSYQVNGLEVTNFRNMMGATFVPMEFVEEVQVKTGGYEAEYGRATGGVINMVTKSGTNRLRGGVSLYWQPRDLQETEPDAWTRHNTIEYSESLEANGSIGGAFVRDKLFFFGFIRYDDTEFMQNFGERNTVTVNDAPYYGAKLDWNLTPNHRLEATYLVDDTELVLDTYSYDPETRTQGEWFGTGWQSRGGTNFILKYTGILSDNFLLSAQGGVNEFDRTDSSTNDVYPAVWDCRIGCIPIGYWVNWSISQGGDRREAYRIDLDWFLGDHSLRGGVDYQKNISDNQLVFSGGLGYIYHYNGSRYPEYPEDQELAQQRYYRNRGSYNTFSNAVYVQDSWAVSPRVTLNLGIRWELFENQTGLGETFIKIDDQYAPRLGVVWDPGGNGRQKLFVSFGQYHLPLASNTNMRMAGAEYFEDTWYLLEGGVNPDGTPVGLGAEIDYIVHSDGGVPDPRYVRAVAFEPMSQLEYILGYEHMAGQSWSLGVRTVWRDFEKVIEDIGLDEALFLKYGADYPMIDLCYNPNSPWFGACSTEYRLTNPGEAFSGWVDLDGDEVLDPVSLTAEELGYPEAIRKYWAIELMARRRFANGWMAQFAYTWSQSYGNLEGIVKSDIGQDDAGLTQDWDFPGLMDNAYGFLPNDRRHNFKAFGAHAWDFGLQLGGYLYYQTGRPRNAIGLHPTDPYAQLYGASSFFYADGTPAPRGTVGTTDDLWGLDAMARYDFRALSLDWYARLDVFNLLDNDAVTYYREYSTTGSGAPDEGFGEPVYYQTPRQVRLGFGLSF